MALFNRDSFPDIGAYDYLVPQVGSSTTPQLQPPHENDPVYLTLSDGRVVTVFDSVRTAMRCLEAMRVQQQSFIIASDDVLIYNVEYHKLFACEASLVNQRLFTSYTPFYSSGLVRFTHRNLSSVETLSQALASVGFAVSGALNFNSDLQAAKAGIVLVDYLYNANPTLTDRGSRLEDNASTLLWYVYNTTISPIRRGRQLGFVDIGVPPSGGTTGGGTTDPPAGGGTTDPPAGGGTGSGGTSSDIRLKKDIKPLATTLETLELLRPVAFRWIANNTQDTGLLAQEVALVAPECVSTDNTGYLRVDYAHLVPYLLQWLQLLSDKVKALQE